MNSRARSIWILTLTLAAVVAPAIPGSGEGRASRYSGTVVAVDQAGRTIVVEGMGPWRIKEGVTQVERRTIGVMPSTEFVRLRRATGPAPSGWVPAWQVKPGDWVTVTEKTDDKRPTALRVEVWEPSEG